MDQADKVHDELLAVLRASRAEFTEVRLERRETTKVVYHGRQLETVDLTIDQGGMVRAVAHGGGWGISTFNSTEGLAGHSQRAYEASRLMQAEPITLAVVEPAVCTLRCELERDFRLVPLAEKKSLIQSYNDVMLSYGNIVDTNAVYADSFVTVTYGNSQGAFIVEERPLTTVRLAATARAAGDVQYAVEGISVPGGYESAIGLEDLAHQAPVRAVALLSAKMVVGGVYPVVVNPELAGVFIHEAFGHLSEADFVYANPQAQEMMVLGRQFGPPELSVVDDGTIPGLRGTHRYDDEGTPMQRTELIRDGVLVGRLHSRETAARMGEQTTGNARATEYRYPPLVRMTNTYIEARQATLQDMLADIKLGVYACDTMGGQTMLENFSFSAGHAYMIRDGHLAELVRDVVLSGNVFSTLRDIDAIGQDLTFAKVGTCGKGPGGLPVSSGAPHIRIQAVAMGGR